MYTEEKDETFNKIKCGLVSCSPSLLWFVFSGMKALRTVLLAWGPIFSSTHVSQDKCGARKAPKWGYLSHHQLCSEELTELNVVTQRRQKSDQMAECRAWTLQRRGPLPLRTSEHGKTHFWRPPCCSHFQPAPSWSHFVLWYDNLPLQTTEPNAQMWKLTCAQEGEGRFPHGRKQSKRKRKRMQNKDMYDPPVEKRMWPSEGNSEGPKWQPSG